MRATRDMIKSILRFEFRVIENPLLVFLDEDFKSSVDELFGGGRSERGATLELLLFASEPESGLGRHVWGQWKWFKRIK